MGKTYSPWLNQSDLKSLVRHEGFSRKWIHVPNPQNRSSVRLEPVATLDCRVCYAENQMTESLSMSCPYCGEAVELDIDESGGSRQTYVQDCPVCCRPWQVDVTRDREGSWNAMLRTTDE